MSTICRNWFVVIGLVSVMPLGLWMFHGLTGVRFRIIGMWTQRRNVDLHPDMKG